VRDLVEHVAEVYEDKIVRIELGHAPDPWPPVWPADRDPIEWLGDAHERLVAMFDRSGTTTPSPTWWPPDQTVGFWARRMALETVVHRVDGEQARGEVMPVDAALATDGIDEILEIMLAGDWSEDADDALDGTSVGISAGSASWQVALERTTVEVGEPRSSPQATIDGAPADVFLWLWGRVPDDHVHRSGNDDVLRALRRRLRLATQ
jgi:uncharacterized protein (TIGR03083 family)